MKIRFQLERCKGHQNCIRSAPELFQIDEHGYASLRQGATVPPNFAEEAWLAWENCPESAIEIEE